MFSIVYDGKQVRYLQNGIVRRTVEIDTPVKLFFDSALGGPSEMTDVSFSYLRTEYDNANVSHAIPQNSLQYTWIKDSAETTIADFQGYATGSDIQFYSNSVGFDSPMNNVYIDPVNATQSFDFTGSVYTYGTWKEIRGSELQLSRHYRKNNILPVTNNEDSTTQYIEPPVVAKHKPLDYLLAIDDTGTPYHVKSAYGNRLMRYSNDAINKLYDFRVSDENTDYAKIKDLYLKNQSLTQVIQSETSSPYLRRDSVPAKARTLSPRKSAFEENIQKFQGQAAMDMIACTEHKILLQHDDAEN